MSCSEGFDPRTRVRGGPSQARRGKRWSHGATCPSSWTRSRSSADATRAQLAAPVHLHRPSSPPPPPEDTRTRTRADVGSTTRSPSNGAFARLNGRAFASQNGIESLPRASSHGGGRCGHGRIQYGMNRLRLAFPSTARET
eukprot:scaffold1401_cov330-Pavlova_lutheri.AAC.60